MPFLDNSEVLNSAREGIELAQSVPTYQDAVDNAELAAEQIALENPVNDFAYENAVLNAQVTAVGMEKEARELTEGRTRSALRASEIQERNRAEAKDLRVHLKAQSGNENQVYGPNTPTNVLSILHHTEGVLFPYTPNIDWTQAVEYNTMSLTHSNQDYHSYKNTPSTTLTVMGDFTIQNKREGEYMVAVIHFLRVVSKMYFGKPSSTYQAGMPPPILTFSGYGNFMFNDLPVIVKNHAFSLPKDVDYIDVAVAGGIARLPSFLSISLTLTVQNTPKKMREEFDLNKFRTGELMRNKKGWI